jgi:hypothetical protein
MATTSIDAQCRKAPERLGVKAMAQISNGSSIDRIAK